MPTGYINPDGPTPRRRNNSRSRVSRPEITSDFLRRILGLEPLDFVGPVAGPTFSGSGSSSRVGSTPARTRSSGGGNIPKPRSQGGYASGWRPGASAPAAPRTQGGYAAGYQPGRYTPRGSSQGGGGVGAGSFGGGMDYAAQWDSIMDSIMNSGAIETPDAAAMAQAQFDPQYDLLSQLRSQTTGRMNQQADDAQAMYDALGQSFDADKSGVTEQYDQAAQSLDAAFSGAGERIQQTGEQSGSELRAMMRQLGINEAGPAALAGIDEAQARSQNSINEMQANYAGANEANRTSMLDYLTNEANTMGVAGANARADVEMMLEQALSGYDNQELGLRGQQAAAENEYAMGIANMQQSAQQSQLEMAQRQFQAMMDQQQWQAQYGLDRDRFEWGQQTDQWDNDLRRAAEERALREFEFEQNSQGTGGSEANTRDASTLIVQEAGKYYEPQKASRVAQMIRNAMSIGYNNTPPETIRELLMAIDKRHPNNPDKELYAHLASMYGQALGLKP